MRGTEIQAVVFDLGGVLVEINHTWGAAAQTAGLEIPERFRDLRLEQAPAMAAYQSGEIDETRYLNELALAFEIAPEHAFRIHIAILRGPYPGAHDLTKKLHKNKRLLGCLSNTNKIHWDELTVKNTYAAIAELNVRVASHQVGLRKPDSLIYELVQRKLNCNPDAIVFFDDASENIDAALRQGWHAKLINPDANPVSQMTDCLKQFGVL